MAAPTQYSNVLVLANGNTITAPCKIRSILVVGGSAVGRVTLTSGVSGTPVVYDSGNVAINTNHNDIHLNIRVVGTDSLTVALTGTGATAYAYIE